MFMTPEHRAKIAAALKGNTHGFQPGNTLGARSSFHFQLRHGHARKGLRSPTYRSWWGMIQRCRNPRRPQYLRYGGRGIMVCERWRVFEHFLADMGERPLGTSIDRIDVHGHYEPGNCQWATPTEQARNRRRPEWRHRDGHRAQGGLGKW